LPVGAFDILDHLGGSGAQRHADGVVGKNRRSDGHGDTDLAGVGGTAGRVGFIDLVAHFFGDVLSGRVVSLIVEVMIGIRSMMEMRPSSLSSAMRVGLDSCSARPPALRALSTALIWSGIEDEIRLGTVGLRCLRSNNRS
jgi:hypothetical protein